MKTLQQISRQDSVLMAKAYDQPTAPKGPDGRVLLQDISPALVVCDDQGKVSYANFQAACLLGVEVRLALGRPASAVFRLEALEGDSIFEKKILDPARYHAKDNTFMDCVLVRPDGGQLRVSCQIAAIGGGATLLALIPDLGGADPDSLAYKANHDALTGLPNRSYLQERLANLHLIAQAQRTAYSLLLLDLDHFKTVNDRFGHATGDQVLVQAGRRIAHHVRELDTVGRWGGEEFLCLLPEVRRPLAEEIAERIRAGLEALPIELQGCRIRVTSSIGVATFPDDGGSPESLLEKADEALYEAKRSGRNRIRSVTGRAGNAFALAQIIEKSLREGRLAPAYQAVVDLVSGKVCGAQAVARIQLDNHQILKAASFIPAAEQLHLLHRIDHRIIRSVIEQYASRKADDEPLPALFVNFSADFLRHHDLVEDIWETIWQPGARCASAGNDRSPLVIEISERQLRDDMDEVRERLQPFLDKGARIAIDHFGGGSSSLACLIDLPVSFIMLEGSLVRRACRERRAHSVLQAVQKLASDLDIITIAKGVENDETVEVLRRIGVDWGQGSYFSRHSFRP